MEESHIRPTHPSAQHGHRRHEALRDVRTLRLRHDKADHGDVRVTVGVPLGQCFEDHHEEVVVVVVLFVTLAGHILICDLHRRQCAAGDGDVPDPQLELLVFARAAADAHAPLQRVPAVAEHVIGLQVAGEHAVDERHDGEGARAHGDVYGVPLAPFDRGLVVRARHPRTHRAVRTHDDDGLVLLPVYTRLQQGLVFARRW
mmetsp:Transcript_30932/g.71484  ORF Transcript_30932/g.71484 Transcript_30932/m.71484 type:complete len:201 (+) Transcript_30932:169-771(+)